MDQAEFAAMVAEFRRVGPVRRVRRSDGAPGWLVTRHADVQAALADPRLSSDLRNAGPELRELPAFQVRDDPLHRYMLSRLDPPRHGQLRGLVSAAFTTRRVEAMRPHVVRVVDALLDAFPTTGTVDLVPAYTLPVAITVICDLLGVPAEDRVTFREWTDVLLLPLTDAASMARSAQAQRWIFEYLSALVDRKRADPGDDLLDVLMQVRDDVRRLNRDEVVAMAVELIVAGFQPTADVISFAAYALLTHPGQLAALRAGPGAMPVAVEEFLRLASPVGLAFPRFATDDLRLGGVDIAKGDQVLISVAAANQDPARFGGAGADAGPDAGVDAGTGAGTGAGADAGAAAGVFDPARTDNPHLAFGHGGHRCVGASLARLETEVAVGALLRRFERMSLAVAPDEVPWRFSLIRGIAALPVTVG